MTIPLRCPVWTPGAPSHFGERHFAYSPKLLREVSFSSKLEYERALLLEFDPSVTAYCEQPGYAEAILGRRVVRSRFDFGVWLSSGEFWLEEVKYTADLKNPGSRAHRQIAIQRAHCSREGTPHRVVTDREIWGNPVLIRSLRTLLPEFVADYQLRRDRAKPVIPLVLRMVRSCRSVTIAQILQSKPATVPIEIFRFAVMELVRCHQLDAHIERIPLTPRSPLTVKYNYNEN